jgi:hypothetical protein
MVPPVKALGNAGGHRVPLSEDGLPENSTLFSARYNKGPAGSAELAFLRLGKDGQGFSVQRRKPGIYRLSLATQAKPLGQSAIFGLSVRLHSRHRR